MKKSRFISLILAFMLLCSMTMPVFAQPETGAEGCFTLLAQKPLAGSEKRLPTAKAVILFELNSGTMVYSWNPDRQVDPSGMNKIMTALLALELGEPDAVITVTRSALDSVPIGSVSAGLKRYEEITLRQLLYCMMVGSANDAAAVIAEHIGTTQAGFVELMNRRATELGCTNTNFANAMGMSAAGQYTTARDLALITYAALQIPAFNDMFCAAEHTVPKTNKSDARQVHTTNYLMSKAQVKDQYDPRVTGGKTGALSTTDRSLICTSEYGNCRYLSVVMSASGTVTEDGLAAVTFGSFEETRALMDFGFGSYDLYTLIREQQAVTQFDVAGGDCPVSVRTNGNLRVTLPKELEHGGLTYRYFLTDSLSAPIQKDAVVGRYEAWYNNICVAGGELVAMHDVNTPGATLQILTAEAQNENRIFQSIALIGGAVIAFAAAIFAAVLLTMRIIVEVRRRKRQAQRPVQRSK